MCDKAERAVLDAEIDDAPMKFELYHLAMARAGKTPPEQPPPPLPTEHRKVVKRRSSSQGDLTSKPATWVASHLCHDRVCVNPAHLVWEPSWFNRMRDNCPGGDGCLHLPHKCLAPHRVLAEPVDWLDYWEEVSEELKEGFRTAL